MKSDRTIARQNGNVYKEWFSLQESFAVKLL